MNPVSVDIKDMLVGAMLGTFGEDIFISREPAEPENCVTIYDTGGDNQDPKFALDEAYFQVRSRNLDYATGYQKLEAIKLELEGKPETLIRDPDNPDNNTNLLVTYLGIWAYTNIAFVQYDQNDRVIFVLNFRTIREPIQAEVGNRQLTSYSG